MKQIASYPYYFFTPDFMITRANPVTKCDFSDNQYSCTIDIPLPKGTSTITHTFTKESLQEDVDAVIHYLPRTHLKAYYMQDMSSLDKKADQLFTANGLSRNFRRSNVILFDDQKERRATYLYARNHQGRVHIEVLFLSVDGEEYPIKGQTMNAVLGNRMYSIKFDRVSNTLKHLDHDLTIFVAHGVLYDVQGVATSIQMPDAADEEADEILEFFENRFSNVLFPNISPFIHIHTRNRAMLDIEL